MRAGGNGEVPEDDDEDKDVVHAQGILDDVAGQEFQGALGAKPEVEQDVEGNGQTDPGQDPAEGLAVTDFVRVAVEDAEIEREHEEDEEGEANPKQG